MLRLIRDLYAQTPNDLAAAEKAWKVLDRAKGWSIPTMITAGQIYNPSQGKGQNRAKADRLAMGNVKGFWLAEFLKAVGFYRAALTKGLRGSKDRKTYVLAPMTLSLTEHDKVFKEFKSAMERSETPVRCDILASIRYAKALLGYSQADEGRSVLRRFVQVGRPRSVVAGFASVFYKNLGNSAATMNLPFVGLPGWLQVATRQDVVDTSKVMGEHERIVTQFDESHSDEHALLLAYRDFCSGEDLEAFFTFAVHYSAFIIGRRERKQYARQFTENNLRRLIMGSDPKLAPILETPGFQNIAYAIRQSTVTAQWRKKQGDRRYDVRYGLGQQLARKAHYADEFIAELSDFLHKYNAKNAQVMETREGPYRRSVRMSDIEEIVRLIDEYGSRTICHLLVAYGYARTSREKDQQGDQ